LPTEEEWELAARGWDGRLYPWGNNAKDDDLVNSCGKECQEHLAKLGPERYPVDDGIPDTIPVGSHPKNVSPFGALDMVGSVQEWTLGDPCKHTTDERIQIKSPCYPNDRVVRGGGGFPAARRFRQNWQSKHPALGFRCVHPGKK
jgi:formylglycine-generating enzyme required for sulfatase activity